MEWLRTNTKKPSLSYYFTREEKQRIFWLYSKLRESKHLLAKFEPIIGKVRIQLFSLQL